LNRNFSPYSKNSSLFFSRSSRLATIIKQHSMHNEIRIRKRFTRLTRQRRIFPSRFSASLTTLAIMINRALGTRQKHRNTANRFNRSKKRAQRLKKAAPLSQKKRLKKHNNAGGKP